MADGSEKIEWLSIPEAMEYLKVSKTTLYECMSDGRLPFYYIKGTRQRRVKRPDLDALLVPGKPGEVEADEVDSAEA